MCRWPVVHVRTTHGEGRFKKTLLFILNSESISFWILQTCTDIVMMLQNYKRLVSVCFGCVWIAGDLNAITVACGARWLMCFIGEASLTPVLLRGGGVVCAAARHQAAPFQLVQFIFNWRKNTKHVKHVTVNQFIVIMIVWRARLAAPQMLNHTLFGQASATVCLCMILTVRQVSIESRMTKEMITTSQIIWLPSSCVITELLL